MPNMEDTMVSLPDELVDRLAELRKTEAFRGCSYSEIIHYLIEAGLSCDTGEKDAR